MFHPVAKLVFIFDKDGSFKEVEQTPLRRLLHFVVFLGSVTTVSLKIASIFLHSCSWLN